MQKQPSHIKDVELYNNIAIVRIVGNVTYDNLKATQEEFALKTKGRKLKNIVFDIKDAPETDTAGIAALIDLLKYMKSHQVEGGIVGLVNISPKIKNLLMISKTQPLFNEYASEEEAIKNLK